MLIRVIQAAHFKTALMILLTLPGLWLNPAFSDEKTPVKNSTERTEFQERIEQDQDAVTEPEVDSRSGYISRLLNEGETRLLGIKWDADVLLDVPINNEPEDSDLTVRRARLSFRKGLGENWRAKVSVEISSGKVELRDNFLEYAGWGTKVARLGVFDEPFSMESMTSARGLTFMERSLPVAALAPGKSVGAGLLRRTQNGILSGGLFLRSPSQDGLGEAGQALAVRWVRSPLFRPEDDDSHFGVSFSYRANAEPEDSRYRTRPETGVTDNRFVDTGDIAGADKILRLGLETSRVQGPFSWQAELMALEIKRVDFDKVFLMGGYIQASWFLTGESRNCDAGTGRFKRIKPNTPIGGGGKGSFELTGRVSWVDLTDEDIIGGEQSNVTLGLNWRPRDNWRVMANLVKVLEVKRPGHRFDGVSPLILSLRLQWEL